MAVKRIFLTGATGFIGRHVTAYLLKQGYVVTAIIRPGRLSPFPPHPRLKLVTADLLEPKSFSAATRGCDAVVHLAANKYHPRLAPQVNITGTRNLAASAIKSGVRRFINISSMSTNIKVKGVYAASKTAQDQLLLKLGRRLDLTILKPSLVYAGREDSLFATIARYAKDLALIPILGNGRWVCHPIHVLDVARFIEACLERKSSIGKTYDLGSRQAISMNELVEKIAAAQSIPSIKIIHVPLFLSLLGGKILNLPFFWQNGRVPPITYDNILGSNQPTHLDPLPAIYDLELKPLTIDQGLALAFAPHPKKLRVAVVGLGKTGLTHAAILNTFPDVNLTALIDTPDKKSTIESYGLTAAFYPTLNSALKKTAIDVVFVCTPTHNHLDQLKLLISRRLPFFVEKTVTANPKQHLQITRLTRNYRLPTAAGYFYQFRPTYHLAEKIVKSGRLGRIINFTGTVLHSEVFGPKKGWLFDKNLSGGGVLINPSPHFFSLVYHFFGLPQKVSARLNRIYSPNIEDEAFVDFHYPRFTGTLYASWSVPNTPVLKTDITITGSKTTLAITSDSVIIKTATSTKILRVPAEKKPRNPILNLSPQSGGDGYYRQDREFIDSLKRGRKFPNDIKTALNIESIIFAAYRAAATGQPQKPL